MRITIVGTAHPLRGGIAHYNALLYRELSKKHHVDIITFTRQYPDFLFPGKTQIDGGGTGDFEVPSRMLVDSISPLNWLRVGRMIRREAPDLLLFKYWLPFFGPCFGTIARMACRGTRTRVVYICDNVIPHEKRPGDLLFTRYAFGRADGFIVQSASVEKDLKTLFPGAHSILVPHPIYHGFGAPVPAAQARKAVGVTGKNVLLFFGYVRKYKGLGVLLEAMALLKNRLDLELLVVGEFYDDEAPYRDRIRSLGLEGHVTVRSDYVPNDEVKNYFSAADAVVLPYSSGTQSGIAQIAYNFDVPVIATTVGGLAEAVRDGETGVLVPPDNPPALADGIVRFFTALDHAKLRARVSEEKRRYSWDHLCAGIETLASDQ
jgi:glycosyltransferase involved in cell wall biosynthesis